MGAGTEVVAQLERIGETVVPSESVDAVRDDPADNRILEAAAAGHADRIVSGDRDLLELGMWRGIRIIRPVDLVD